MSGAGEHGADLRARNAVTAAFVLNGWCFATLVSRVPDLRSALDLSNGGLGLLLLTSAAGSLVGMPLSGRLIERWSASGVVRLGAALVAAGLLLAGIGAAAWSAVPPVAAGLFAYGLGTGTWDVAMNVEGAEVERRLRRTVMPRFHAAWSFGSIAGAGLGVLMAGAAAPLPLHYGAVGLLALGAVLAAVGAFLPPEAHGHAAVEDRRSAWLEPRTLAIGLMVLAFALAEGSANDWLALALIDGHDARHWVGVAGFAVFVTAMTTGRLVGPLLLDRWGRAPVLVCSALAAALGIIVVVYAAWPGAVVVGIVVWGLGASLGFPVGMSAAADDPRRSARRVSVVSTIGYAAFLGGPPLLGFVGDRVGTLESLLVVAAAMVPATALVAAVRRRPPRPSLGP